MKELADTAENKAKVEAIKTVKETQWVGEVTHDTLDKALVAINLFQGSNSGWHKPTALKLKRVIGIFMINEDGGLNFESRVLKIDDSTYKIEHLSIEGYNTFERKYIEALSK